MINNIDKLTKLEQYALYAQGRLIFSDAIIAKDVDRKFSKEVIEYKVDKEEYAKESLKYIENKEKYEDSIAKYKSENKEKFETTYAIPNINEMFEDFTFEVDDLSLDQCIEGYKYCNEKMKSFDKSEISTVPRVTIKLEYKDEYKSFCDKMREKYNYPTMTTICQKLEKKVEQKKDKLCLNRVKCSDDTAYIELEKQFINFKENK